MKRFNKAFTLSELLIALGVIGILCAILLPVIFNLMPNQNTMMAKRAYYIVQSVVADIINDEACYPDKSSATTADKRLGFDDGYGYSNCTLWGGGAHTETIETYREIADAIAAHDPLRAQDAMYLHLVYNRKRIQLIENKN